MDWFKFYGAEYLSDPKIMALNSLERSCWITLLSIASVSDDGGRVRFVTPERLLMMAGVDPTEDEWMGAEHIFDKFVEFGMVTRETNGDVTITNWKKRQESYITSADRSRKWRERIKTTRERHANDTLANVERHARGEEKRVDKKRIDNKDGFSNEKGEEMQSIKNIIKKRSV